MVFSYGAFCCVALLLCGGLQAKGTPPGPDESGHALPVDDLRDLLLASMQNTISLTELATQQATKVSAITTSLIEARNEIDQLKSKIDKLEEEQNKNLSGTTSEIEGLKSNLSAKIDALEEGQIEQKENLSGTTSEIEGLKSDLSAKIDKLEEGQIEQNENLSGTTSEIEGLKSNISAKIDALEEGQIEQNENLSGTISEIEGLKSDLSAKIDALKEGQSELTAQIGDVSWPKGSYCILASGSCPAGFTRYSGHIRAFNTYDHTPTYIKVAAFGDSYMRCHGYCGQHTSYDAEFGITSCCK